ncbi:MAG: GspH/FimT family pseudopilin [Lysobacter sp.]|nr:GspH/FimT family pseudopilin [Lysobacter sp.]
MLCKRTNGFTLVELMVVIAIVAVLATLALPSFEGSMRSNRVATTTNEMMASLALARSEAIRSSRSSRVCASSDGATCVGTWNDGWIVATDMDANRATWEQLVRVVQAHPKMAIAGAGGTSATIITYDYRGRPNNGGVNRTISVQPDTCPSGQKLIRTMTLNGVGQINMTKGTCT